MGMHEMSARLFLALGVILLLGSSGSAEVTNQLHEIVEPISPDARREFADVIAETFGLTHSGAVVLNADGGKTETVTDTNNNGSLRDKTVTTTSADRRTISHRRRSRRQDRTAARLAATRYETTQLAGRQFLTPPQNALEEQ